MDFDLARFHAGDDALFTALVRLHSPRLLPQLRRYAEVDADVHDLLQEVWLRAFTKRRTFDGRGSFIGWLLAVSRSVGMSTVRKHKHESVGESPPEIAVERDDDDRLLGQTMRDAILALPERQRDAVLLRLVEGLSTADTARRLECAEGTVKALLHQGTRKLRECLKENVT